MTLNKTLNNCIISKKFFFNRLKNRGKIVNIYFPFKGHNYESIVQGEIIWEFFSFRKNESLDFIKNEILIKPLNLTNHQKQFIYYDDEGFLSSRTCRYFSETDIIWD